MGFVMEVQSKVLTWGRHIKNSGQKVAFQIIRRALYLLCTMMCILLVIFFIIYVK